MTDRLGMELYKEIGAFLIKRKEAIIARWEEFSQADKLLPEVSKLTHEEFRNNIPHAIDALVRELSGRADNEEHPARDEVRKHGQHRWKQGFSLQQLVRDWGHLNAALLEVVHQYVMEKMPDNPARQAEITEILVRFYNDALSYSVVRYDELKRAEAQGLNHDLVALRESFETQGNLRAKMMHEVSHDLKTGLTSLAGASEMLKSGVAVETGTVAELADIFEDGLNSVKSLVNELVELSRIDAGRERVDIEEFCAAKLLKTLCEGHRHLAADKDLSLVYSGPSELNVRTDRQKVRRILQNLIFNGIKYTEEGGVSVTLSATEQRWTIVISDTGPGLQATDGPPIAEELNHPDTAIPADSPPASPKYTGEGIGLTIVKRLCSLLDAQIDLDSEPGQGTAFTLTFAR
ncbi:MAG: sensor histidine kinase [Opitutales bacterium]